MRLTRRNAPWAFARGEPFRTIASLELMGALLGVMVLLPVTDFDRPGESTGLVTFGCGTDSLGHDFLVDTLMTTTCPLGLILIELAHQLSLRRAALRAQWISRMQNEEADALTNEDFRHFCPGRMIPVDLARLPSGLLPQLFEQGKSFVAELDELKRATKAAGPGPKRAKKQGDSLAARQPWG